MKAKRHFIPESIKRKIIDEYLTTDVTQRELMARYKIRGNNLDSWIRKFGAENGSIPPLNEFLVKKEPKPYVEPLPSKDNLTMEEELFLLRKENAALKDERAYDKLKIEALDTMINLAEEQFQIPIRKKSGANQSKF